MFEVAEVQQYLAHDAALFQALEIEPGASLELHHLGSGIHNANYWFEHPATHEKLALRVHMASQIGLTAADQIRYEADALRWLEPCGRTPHVRYVCEHAAELDSAVLVSNYVPGEWLDFDRPSHIVEAVHVLADIHAVPVTEACPVRRPADPLHAQLKHCLGMYGPYQQTPSVQIPRATAAIDELIASIQRDLESIPPAVDAWHIQNTEAVPSHFLIPKNGEPGYMVDWEQPVVGEVAQDLAYFMSPTSTSWDTDFVFSVAERQRVLDSYWNAVAGRFGAADFERRFPLYVKMNCLVGLTWYAKAAVDYAREEKPAGAEKVLRLLDMVFGEEFLQLCRDICF